MGPWRLLALTLLAYLPHNREIYAIEEAEKRHPSPRHRRGFLSRSRRFTMDKFSLQRIRP